MDSVAELTVRESHFPQAHSADGIVPHRNWTAARDLVREALRRGTKITAVLGHPGIGKTLMLEDIARTLDASGTEVWLLPPGEAVCGSDENGVVLIDEDCHVNTETWSRMFQSPGRYVIAGQPMLAQYLKTFPSGVELVFIDPLDAHDVAPSITPQLRTSAEPTDQYPPAAIDRATEHASAAPQNLNTFDRSVLRVDDTEKAGNVEPPPIDEAAGQDIEHSTRDFEQSADLEKPDHRILRWAGQQSWTVKAFGLASAGAIVAAAAVLLNVGGDNVSRTPAPASVRPASIVPASVTPPQAVIAAKPSAAVDGPKVSPSAPVTTADPAASATQSPTLDSSAAQSSAAQSPTVQPLTAQPPIAPASAPSLASEIPPAAPTPPSAKPPTTAQSNGGAQHGRKHHVTSTHSPKHHHKPAPTTHPSSQPPRA